MKKLYSLLLALATIISTYSQPPSFYNMSYKVPLPQQNMWYPPAWKSIGSSDSALYVVGNNSVDNKGICFISYHNGGMKCVYTGTSNIILKGVQFLSNSVGFIWGEQGTLLKTSDGGNTWINVPTSTTSAFDKLQVIDENTIFYMTGSTMMKTQDGGTTWTQITLPTTVPINSFNFFDALNGILCGGQYLSPNFLGYLYKTTDGGINWVQSYIDSTRVFEKLFFINDSVGFIKSYQGSYGEINKTTDQGNTWNVISGLSYWTLVSDIVSYNNGPAYVMSAFGPGTVISGVPNSPQATGAFDIYSLSYNGAEMLYVLSDSGLYRYMTGGPSYQGLTFFNGVIPNSSNPTNSLLPGRRVRFKVNVKNNLATNLLTLSGKIRCNSPYITITDSIGTYNNVLANASAWSADEFELELAGNTPDNYVPQLELILEDQIQTGDPWISIFSFPIVFSPFAVSFNIIDDDNIPDSNGDNDDVAEPGETIEIIPLADNINPHTFGNMEGYLFSPLSEINIWADTMGSTATVYNHYPYGIIDTLTQPSEDFVFTNNFTSTYNLLFSMVFTGNIKYFMVDGNYNGYIAVDSTIQYRWATDFAMNNGFPNPPTLIETEENSYGPLDIFPNPTTGKFSINSNEIIASIEIYNILGEKVGNWQLPIGKKETTIDLTDKTSGIYFIHIKSGEKSFYSKLIKQ